MENKKINLQEFKQTTVKLAKLLEMKGGSGSSQTLVYTTVCFGNDQDCYNRDSDC
ncbi:MAG: hypothetical protein QM564_02410 [Bergeyella sp.]